MVVYVLDHVFRATKKKIIISGNLGKYTIISGWLIFVNLSAKNAFEEAFV
jgi:hypothetical protein